MSIKYNIFACVSKNMGIGKNNDLPWNLPSELQYYINISNPTGKKNVYIMGRKTWEGFPKLLRDLPNRIHFVISSSTLNFDDTEDVYGFKSWDEINDKLKNSDFKKQYQNVWVIGGTQIYDDAMKSKYFYRLYLTRIQQEFDCDTFFPTLVENIRLISDPNVPTEMQEENGVQFKYEVYENTLYKDEQ